jgi:hypothetical protein
MPHAAFAAPRRCETKLWALDDALSSLRHFLQVFCSSHLKTLGLMSCPLVEN